MRYTRRATLPAVEVSFEQGRLARTCNSEKEMLRKFGSTRAKVVQRRLAQFSAAGTLDDLRSLPGRCHELTADRSGQLSVDLDGPHRLIFRPTEDPSPAKDDGGLDWVGVTAITIIEITDTH